MFINRTDTESWDQRGDVEKGIIYMDETIGRGRWRDKRQGEMSFWKEVVKGYGNRMKECKIKEEFGKNNPKKGVTDNSSSVKKLQWFNFL